MNEGSIGYIYAPVGSLNDNTTGRGTLWPIATGQVELSIDSAVGRVNLKPMRVVEHSRDVSIRSLQMGSVRSQILCITRLVRIEL